MSFSAPCRITVSENLAAWDLTDPEEPAGLSQQKKTTGAVKAGDDVTACDVVVRVGALSSCAHAMPHLNCRGDGRCFAELMKVVKTQLY